jgi:hypothetical protein
MGPRLLEGGDGVGDVVREEWSDCGKTVGVGMWRMRGFVMTGWEEDETRPWNCDC